MKFLCKSIVFSIMFSLLLCSVVFAQDTSLLQKAVELEKNGNYTEAYNTYEQARKEFQKSGDTEQAENCKKNMQRIELIGLEYPYTEDDIKKILAESFSNIPEKERNSWISEGKIESIIIDGQLHYFQNFVNNLKSRNKDLRDEESLKGAREFFNKLHDIIYKSQDTSYPQKIWQPYINPITFLGTSTLDVPREKLPKTGILKIWFPIPVLTGAQTGVRIISITPEKYVKIPTKIDGDLGLAYMEIPLDELKEELNIKIEFTFSHYEQNFIIDPNSVGEYDRDSFLYKQYTSSHDNTVVNEEIKKKAEEIVGNEKNPYLAARKIYFYIVNNMSYSLMPHVTLGATKSPECLYINEKGFGDCGTQSAYFSALCRACGIPARTTGGYQMCLGTEGTHFWAEFYLPNYGWVPADTSVGQIADSLPELSEKEKEQFKSYYFGSMDPYRFVIQKDIDVPLVPKPEDPILFTMAIQMPVFNCDKSEKIMDLISLLEYYKIKITPVNR